MRKFGMLVAALSIIGTAAPVLAHHGFDTEYDANKHVKLEGVVTMVPSQHAAASATAPRTTNLAPTATRHLPTCPHLLLDRLRRVRTTGAEQRFHVALLHDRLQ